MKYRKTIVAFLIVLSSIVLVSSCLKEEEPEKFRHFVGVSIYDFDFKPLEDSIVDYADLIIKLNKDKSSIIYKSEWKYNIVKSDLPIRLNFAKPILAEPKSIYILQLYDRDTIGSDDLILDFKFHGDNPEYNDRIDITENFEEKIYMIVHCEDLPL